MKYFPQGTLKIALSVFFILLSAVTAYPSQRFTLVIDAGHGGHDAGACGLISKEKDLTLRYALAFGRMVEANCPDVRVIYTRKTDKFLPLWQRAEIANKNKADLFISVHINSVEGSRAVRGVQTYTLGRGETTGKKGLAENLAVAKRENSVIYLEKDYKQTYKGFDPNSSESNIMFEFIQDKNMERSVELAKFMQRNICASTGRKDMGAHQNNLAVLRLSSMPGCLLELGFISTPDEEAFLNAETSTSLYAQGIFKAFQEYRNKYDTNIVVPYKSNPTPPTQVPSIVPEDYKQEVKPEQKETKKVVHKPVQNTEKPVFKVQIMASEKKIPLGSPLFKGLTGVESYMEGGMTKYTYGSSGDYNEMLKVRREVAEKFPGAFIIAFKNGQKMDINKAIQEFKQNKK